MIKFGGASVLLPFRRRYGPGVLTRASDFSEDEKDKDAESAVRDRMTGRQDNEESGEVVGDEEDVGRVEGDVVDEIGQEIGGAEVEDQVLEGGVRGGEAAEGVGEEGGDGQ